MTRRGRPRSGQLRRAPARQPSTPSRIEVASLEARQANELIDRRTFSWTELFNRLETTLPPEGSHHAVRRSTASAAYQSVDLRPRARGGRCRPVHGEARATGAFARCPATRRGANHRLRTAAGLARDDLLPTVGHAPDGARPERRDDPGPRVVTEKRGDGRAARGGAADQLPSMRSSCPLGVKSAGAADPCRGGRGARRPPSATWPPPARWCRQGATRTRSSRRSIRGCCRRLHAARRMTYAQLPALARKPT